MKTKHLSNILLSSLLVSLGQVGFSQTKLLDFLQDKNAQEAVFLIYNNIDAARAKAKCTNTSRCFSHFDASPATPARGSTLRWQRTTSKSSA